MTLLQRPKLKIISALLTLLLFTSCATKLDKTSEGQNEDSWYRWGASGKMSIKIDSSNQNANLLWESTDNDYQILIYGPLGQGKINIEKTGDRLSLKSDGEVRYAESPEDLLLETTGLDLPISSLSYWIRGLANPKANADITENYEGKIQSMNQHGWNIRYASYYGANDWIESDTASRKRRNIRDSRIGEYLFPNRIQYLPKKIILNKINSEAASTPTQTSPQIKVTLVIKEWQP